MEKMNVFFVRFVFKPGRAKGHGSKTRNSSELNYQIVPHAKQNY